MLSTFYTIVMISGDIAAISRLASSSTLTLQYLSMMHKLSVSLPVNSSYTCRS